MLMFEHLGGFFKLKKIREKQRLSRPHPPTRLSIFLFFWKYVQRKKTTQKNRIFQKKKRNPS